MLLVNLESDVEPTHAETKGIYMEDVDRFIGALRANIPVRGGST